ncbi:hypothetical protein B0H13DRAFT_1591433, partial [Mycena leptocephala]
ARWTVGPSWPNNGEIDMPEGVLACGANKMTLHISAREERVPGCIGVCTTRAVARIIQNEIFGSSYLNAQRIQLIQSISGALQ